MHLGWPYELSELTVLLDGELQYRRRGGLTQMKALRTIADEASHRGRSATDPDEKRHQSTIEFVALAKIAAEFGTVRGGLICEYPAFVGGPQRWVSGPNCDGLGELDPLPNLVPCGVPGGDPLTTECSGQPPALR